jgi:hypothetical protein
LSFQMKVEFHSPIGMSPSSIRSVLAISSNLAPATEDQ